MSCSFRSEEREPSNLKRRDLKMEQYMEVCIRVKFADKAKAPMEFLKGLEEDLDAMAKAAIIEDFMVYIDQEKPVIIRFDEEFESAD